MTRHIAVSFAVALLAAAAIPTFPSTMGCTPAEDATAVKIIDAACLDIEVAASVIPVSAIQVAAADIGLVCTDVPIANIVAFLTDLFAGQADAGIAPPEGPYVPSPHVRAALARIHQAAAK
jgi:hypothetical protein